MNDIEKNFISVCQKASQAQGLDDDLAVEIFALAYLSPKETSMEDIAKKTGYSLASISNKLKVLEQFKLIEKRKKPGSKKIYFYAEKNIFKMMLTASKRKKDVLKNIVMVSLSKIIKESKPKTKEDKQKLKIIQNYLNQVTKFEKMLEKMIKEIEKK